MFSVESLPADGGAGSFDTVGASQFISSDQFEQYLELGRTAVDEAFARHSAMAKPSTVFRVEPERTVNVEHLEMIKKMEERLEAAQADQKNLFLIIFQVQIRKGPL